MRETILSWISNKLGMNKARHYILNSEDRKKEEEDFKRSIEESYKRLIALQEDRKITPLKCNICSEKQGADVFFEGLSWYHCPKCNNHGFASLSGEDECTSCSNIRTHGWT